MEDLKPGDTLTAEFVNYLLAMAAASGITLDGSSGLAGYSGGLGTVAYAPSAPPRWCKITGGGTGGVYDVLEQVPDGAGAWQDGVAFTAREPNGITTLAASALTFVRCYYTASTDEWTFPAAVCP